VEESAAKATGLARPAGTRVVLGDLTAGWQRCRRGAGGPAGANEHGQLLASVAGTPPDAGLVVAVSLRRRWSAQVSHGSQQWQQTADSGCLQQQQQRRRSRQPPAVADEAGDATSQSARACARGQMAPGADRGCPGPGRCARSRARPQRGRVPRARAWARARRAPRTNSRRPRTNSATRGGPAAAACRWSRRRPAHRRVPWAPARGLAAAARVTEPATAPSSSVAPEFRMNCAPFCPQDYPELNKQVLILVQFHICPFRLRSAESAWSSRAILRRK
jgi:hypothetical protein